MGEKLEHTLACLGRRVGWRRQETRRVGRRWIGDWMKAFWRVRRGDGAEVLERIYRSFLEDFNNNLANF